MAKREEEKAYRAKRIKAEKDEKKLIAENGLDGKVIDVYDILARSNNPVVIKLRKLTDYGVTDEMIGELYGSLTSNVETPESAMDTLSSVYKNLVRYINKLPNGIVIDPRTGEKNEIASYRQAQRLGITDDQYYGKLQETGKKLLKEEIKKGIDSKDNKIDIKKYEYYISKNIFGNIDFFKLSKEIASLGKSEEDYRKEISLERWNKAVKEGEDLLNTNKEIKDIPFKERLKKAPILLLKLFDGNDDEKSKSYEIIKGLFSDIDDGKPNGLTRKLIIELTGEDIDINDSIKLKDTLKKIAETENNDIKLEAKERLKKEKVLIMEARFKLVDKSSPEYNKILDELEKFYAQNPECKEYAETLRDDNGNLTQDAEKDIKDYIAKIRNNEILAKLEEYKNCDKSKLTDEEKRNYTSFFLVGTSTTAFSDTRNEAEAMLKEMYPELYNDENNERLEDIVNMILGDNSGAKYDIIECTQKLFSMRNKLDNMLIDGASKQSQEITDNDMNEYYEEKAVDIDISFDLTKSLLQNKFNGSKIDFTDKDEECFNRLYSETTVKTWIDSKDEVMDHRYMAIMILSERSKEHQLKHKAYENIFGSFKRRNPEVHERFSSLSEEQLEKLKKDEEEFQINRLEAKVLDFCNKKIISHEQGYYDMENNEKSDFLRIVLVARELAEMSDNPEKKDMLLKLSNRGLELMNTEEQKFITFDENGEVIIDENSLISEYNNCKTSIKSNRSNIKDLQQEIYEKYRNLYVYGKMKEYSSLEASDFVELKSETMEEKLEEINQIRKNKNLERRNQKSDSDRVGNESKKQISEKQEPSRVQESNISEDIVSQTINTSDLLDKSEQSQSLVEDNNSLFTRVKRSFYKIRERIKKYFNSSKEDSNQLLDKSFEEEKGNYQNNGKKENKDIFCIISNEGGNLEAKAKEAMSLNKQNQRKEQEKSDIEEVEQG